MEIALTPKERQLLAFIEEYQLEHGGSPTIREMREHMNLKSDGFIVYCLKSLEKKHAIEKDDTPRGIKLLPLVSEKLRAHIVKLPVVGNIPAGGPVAAQEHVEDWMSFEEGSVPEAGNAFVLKVRGDSMIGAGIFEGDFVIVSTTKEPRVGDVVAALIDGGSTLKRFMKLSGRAFLKAENPAYTDLLPLEELQVQGVVVGLLRWY